MKEHNHQYPEVFARFYDLIYHQVRDGVDSDFFRAKISEARGKVLEIGVGTGRFFTDALKEGADIYGIDISTAMLDMLKEKLDAKDHHRISCQNIIDFKFDVDFDLIIAPFRVFMHILDKKDQLTALNNVYQHLNPGGCFIFDTFVPDLKQLITGWNNFTDFEGEYAPGKQVKRIVSTTPDIINQLIDVTFTFIWDENETENKEAVNIPLRFFFRYELEHLLERSSFDHYQILGDYQGNQLSSDSKEFIMICHKENQ